MKTALTLFALASAAPAQADDHWTQKLPTGVSEATVGRTVQQMDAYGQLLERSHRLVDAKDFLVAPGLTPFPDPVFVGTYISCGPNALPLEPGTLTRCEVPLGKSTLFHDEITAVVLDVDVTDTVWGSKSQVGQALFCIIGVASNGQKSHFEGACTTQWLDGNGGRVFMEPPALDDGYTWVTEPGAYLQVANADESPGAYGIIGYALH